jgi:hypothetical protein
MFESPDERSQTFAMRSIVGGYQFAQQVHVGPSIYGQPRIVDFVVYNPDLFPNSLIIECKWQQAAGSVDEKFPFLVANIDALEVPTIILLDGGGYKPGAEAWLRDQAGTGSLLAVYTMSEFQAAVNRGLLG